MSENPDSHRYIEVTRRLSLVTVIGASLISTLLLVATWGDWFAFAVIAGVQVALIPFNVWINLRLLKRLGVRRAEILRTVLNLSGVLAGALVAGWPFPVWFWMLFVALAFDEFGARAYWSILIAFILVQLVGGFLSGSPWIYPLCFVAFALFCNQITAARTSIIRHMLVRSDEQRAQIETAHAETRRAHEQVVEEIRIRQGIEGELRQAQKLEAVGRLAAGVAHEINTPVQFVRDSFQFVREAHGELLTLIEAYRRVHLALADGVPLQVAQDAVTAAEEEVDLDYLVTELPGAMNRSLEGLDRIAAIVRSMKDFAHPDRKDKTPVDINQAIQSTLTIARGEYKHVARVETDLAPLPLISCHAGEINQVLLNLIVNAAHAIEDGPTEELGRITVRSRLEEGQVVVEIQDTGIGIPLAIRDLVFDPFFTTKQTGRGTGQGLAIARAVVQRHGGSLTFESQVGAGATFFLRLPVQAATAADVAA